MVVVDCTRGSWTAYRVLHCGVSYHPYALVGPDHHGVTSTLSVVRVIECGTHCIAIGVSDAVVVQRLGLETREHGVVRKGARGLKGGLVRVCHLVEVERVKTIVDGSLRVGKRRVCVPRDGHVVGIDKGHTLLEWLDLVERCSAGDGSERVGLVGERLRRVSNMP